MDETIREQLKETAAKYSDYVIRMRRYFHQHPELTDCEFNTAKVIREELDKIGVEWRVCGMETGTLATIRGAKPGRTIMLRGDIDALPVQEDTGLDFASENDGVMHACGHDCHAAMLLTAAHILNDMKDELCGTVKLAFQPAEEQAHGAEAMIKDGVLEGVDKCFGIHVWADVEAGKISCPAGPTMAGAHKFAVDIIGRGGHGAYPDMCIDPVAAAGAVLTNIQSIVSREIAPLQPALVTIGHIEGGATYNVIPDNVHLDGTMRCFDMDLFNKMPEMLEYKIRETAGAYHAKTEFKDRVLCPPVVNDEEISEICESAANELFGAGTSVKGKLTMGGEDYANYLLKVPGAMCELGIHNEAKNCVYPQHSAKYCIDEDVLLHGAMIYSAVAIQSNAK